MEFLPIEPLYPEMNDHLLSVECESANLALLSTQNFSSYSTTSYTTAESANPIDSYWLGQTIVFPEMTQQQQPSVDGAGLPHVDREDSYTYFSTGNHQTITTENHQEDRNNNLQGAAAETTTSASEFLTGCNLNSAATGEEEEEEINDAVPVDDLLEYILNEVAAGEGEFAMDSYEENNRWDWDSIYEADNKSINSQQQRQPEQQQQQEPAFKSTQDIIDMLFNEEESDEEDAQMVDVVGNNSMLSDLERFVHLSEEGADQEIAITNRKVDAMLMSPPGTSEVPVLPEMPKLKRVPPYYALADNNQGVYDNNNLLLPSKSLKFNFDLLDPAAGAFDGVKPEVNTPDVMRDIFGLHQSFPQSFEVPPLKNNTTISSNVAVEEKPQIPPAAVASPEMESSSTIVVADLKAKEVYTITPVPSPLISPSSSSRLYIDSPADSSFSNSVQSPASSSCSSKRGRGRPRKAILTSFDPKRYEGLSATEKKYKMLRDKNNEASRRSRLHRTKKTRKADKEVRQLERLNRGLQHKLGHIESLQDKLREFIQIILSK